MINVMSLEAKIGPRRSVGLTAATQIDLPAAYAGLSTAAAPRPWWPIWTPPACWWKSNRIN